MNEMNRVDLDAETPVNPYSLLEAVNRSSDSANTAWLIYIGLMSYLLVTVAGITHKDLLLNSDIPLPILQVKIELTRFFLFAPILLVLIHIGVICQLVLVARKTLEFAAAVRLLETTDQRTHPLRLELDNFFFVQALAGPERSPIVGFVLHAMSWLTLVVMPVALLAYVQVVFLPYHDPAITWVHRAALLSDIAFMMLVGVFLLHIETSFLRALLHTSIYHPLSFLLTAGLLATVAAGSLFVATIPGEGIGRQADGDGQGVMFGYALPVGTEPVFGLFRRSLVVTDTDLVVDKDVTPGEPSLNLRGRDLRFARLDRTDLHQADMTGANLDGASFVGADLRSVWMGCADLAEMLLTDSRRAANCASARATNFSKARLSEARMAGADLTGARLDEAQLEGAQLAQARLSGATLTSARLDRADLSGAELSGANFLLVSLQGA
ncbi:MAG TPA: pentapeptide repeat-containing protein, partial [Hyphomicrobiaceae bacterium]|nr:pentapeptide repeat-containing protein [Hyphomicrobiaceae bacterium]